MGLMFAICKPQPNWMPRKPKLMFQICQKERRGFCMEIFRWRDFAPIIRPMQAAQPCGSQLGQGALEFKFRFRIDGKKGAVENLSLIHISEPTRLGMISYAV